MKQPELGKKIIELRKQLNLTQEELVEKCNVNVRTLQRIEAGEVTPRLSTLRVLTEAMGQDFDEVFGSTEKAPFLNSLFVFNLSADQAGTLLQSAWIAGLIYFALGIVEAAADFLLDIKLMTIGQQLFVITAEIGVLISYFFFMRGFLALGKIYGNYLLRISGYLMVACYFFLVLFDVYHVISPLEDDHYMFIQASAAITFGVIGLLYGIAIIRLNRQVGSLAMIAGIFELLIGVFFMTIFGAFVALLLLIPATILEVVILYKVAEGMEKRSALA